MASKLGNDPIEIISLDAVSGAIKSSLEDLIGSNFLDDQEEEGITTTIMAMLLTNFKWCAHYCEAPSTGIADVTWTSYRKSGRGQGSEAFSGADFGIIIKSPDEVSYLALFQAKKGHINRNNAKLIDINRTSKAIAGAGSSTRRIQIEQLCNTAKLIMDKKNLRDCRTATVGDDFLLVDWIHYLAYFRNGIYTKPFNKMNKYLRKEIDSNGNGVNNVPIEDGVENQFLTLMERGIDISQTRRDGWLNINEKDVEKSLGIVFKIMDVYLIDTSSGPAPKIADAGEDSKIHTKTFSTTKEPLSLSPESGNIARPRPKRN